MLNDTNLEIGEFLHSEKFFQYPSLEISPAQSNVLPSVKNTETSQMQISDYLVAFTTQTRSYCIGCVDMVNSTKISSRLSPNQLSLYYEIFLNSMSRIIGRFRGRVIKNVGDCLLYYFPDSKNSIKENIQNCLDCGLVMTEAQPMINKQLKSKALPGINYRVSQDYGSVLIMKTTDSKSIDMIGPAVNVCAKINYLADKNEFVVGGDLKEIAKKIDTYQFESTKGFDSGFVSRYAVFKVKRK